MSNGNEDKKLNEHDELNVSGGVVGPVPENDNPPPMVPPPPPPPGPHHHHRHHHHGFHGEFRETEKQIIPSPDVPTPSSDKPGENNS